MLPRICGSNPNRKTELILKNSSDFAFLGLGLQNERLMSGLVDCDWSDLPVRWLEER
jgi:hypothetical protein